MARQLLDYCPRSGPARSALCSGQGTQHGRISIKGFARILLAATFALAGGAVDAQDAGMKKWTKGKGWDGFLGTSATKSAARAEARDARKTYDLGLPTLRPLLLQMAGPQPRRILSRLRLPLRGASRYPRAATDHGVAQQRDLHKRQCRDADRRGLGHITHEPKNEFYNGFTSDEWGGDFGLRKADVTTISPIVARGVLLDIAGPKNVEALPAAERRIDGVDEAVTAYCERRTSCRDISAGGCRRGS